MFRPGPPRDRLELPARFSFLDFEIDCEAVRASRGGQPVALEPKAFDLLLLLAANPGRVVEKQEIFERIWPDAVVTDNALARVVTHLRRELGDSAEQARIVETVRTRGYRFLPEIEVRSDVPAPVASAPGREQRAPGRHGRWLAIATAGVAAVALLAWWRVSASPAAKIATWSAAPTQLTVDTGYRGHADFSPDGSQVVYSSDEGGGLQLFVRPLEGWHAIQITSGGGPKIDAAWSPDGRSIAYRDLAAEGLWLVAPTGGPPRQITDFGSQPAWFPDGERLVFASPGRPTLGALEWPATYASTLWTVELRTGTIRQLTTPDPEAGGHGMPSVSPDGRWIYFGTGRQIGGGALWRVAATGGRPERLIGVEEESERIDYRFWLDPIPLPGGGSLLAIETGPGRRIVRIGLGGDRTIEPLVTAAPPGIVGLALASDGKRLVYTKERNQTSIEELDLEATRDSSAAIRVLSAPATLRVLAPRYSPDGARLMFQRRRPGVGPELVVLERASQETLTFAMVSPGYSWLGPARIALGRSGGFAEIDLETGRLRDIPRPAGAERLEARSLPRPIARLPGNRTLAFTAAATEGGQELFLGDLETGAEVQLTRLGRRIAYPFFSRDGRWIGFQVAAETGADNELWRIRTAGGPPERLPVERGPSWGGAFSPDGERVVYAAHRQGRWYLAIAGPDSPERLLDVPPETVGYLRWPDWSPDGRYIAYERMRHHASLWSVELPPPR